MIIYGEYLFLENFITGIIITYIAGELVGIRDIRRGSKFFSKRARYFYVGLLCGAYSFIIFVTMNQFMALASKILFALLCVEIAFLPKSLKVAIKEGLVFFIISFLMGGMTIGLLYLFKGTGLASNGAVYLNGINYMNITLGVSATLLVGVWIRRFFKERTARQRLRYQVSFRTDHKEYSFRGLIDTGNYLKDPLSKRQVHLLRRGAIGGQLDESLMRIIPYRAVGKKGVIKAFMVDQLIITNEEEKYIFPNQLIGLCDEEFAARGCYEYDILLNAQMMELDEKGKIG